MDHHENLIGQRAGKVQTYLYNMLYGIGILAGLIGIATAICNIVWITGLIFLICSIMAFINCGIY
jgi:hypothetical protein